VELQKVIHSCFDGFYGFTQAFDRTVTKVVSAFFQGHLKPSAGDPNAKSKPRKNPSNLKILDRVSNSAELLVLYVDTLLKPESRWEITVLEQLGREVLVNKKKGEKNSNADVNTGNTNPGNTNPIISYFEDSLGLLPTIQVTNPTAEPPNSDSSIKTRVFRFLDLGSILSVWLSYLEGIPMAMPKGGSVSGSSNTGVGVPPALPALPTGASGSNINVISGGSGVSANLNQGSGNMPGVTNMAGVFVGLYERRMALRLLNSSGMGEEIICNVLKWSGMGEDIICNHYIQYEVYYYASSSSKNVNASSSRL
jgi:hypothetical protein